MNRFKAVLVGLAACAAFAVPVASASATAPVPTSTVTYSVAPGIYQPLGTLTTSGSFTVPGTVEFAGDQTASCGQIDLVVKTRDQEQQDPTFLVTIGGIYANGWENITVNGPYGSQSVEYLFINCNAPVGTPGPAGPQGPAGANGANGVNGTNGTNGVSGKNAVTVEKITPPRRRHHHHHAPAFTG